MINEVRAHLSYSLKRYELYHYSISGSYDIDLVIETRPKSVSKCRKVILVEIKNSKRIDRDWVEPLLDFEKFKKIEVEAKYVVYRGTEKKTIHGVNFVPVEEFLADMPF